MTAVERRHFRCIEDVCLCCICSLRASQEFGDAIDPDDDCCQGCHDEMAASGWPGRCCGSLPPDPFADATGT